MNPSRGYATETPPTNNVTSIKDEDGPATDETGVEGNVGDIYHKFKQFVTAKMKKDTPGAWNSDVIPEKMRITQDMVDLLLWRYPNADALKDFHDEALAAPDPLAYMQGVLKTVSKPLAGVAHEILKFLKEAFAAGVTVEALEEEYIAKASRAGWTRPTPAPPKVVGRDVAEPLEKASTIGDGRARLLGIGNAYGVGKTEEALRRVEATLKDKTKGVTRVAYFTCSNGYERAMAQLFSLKCFSGEKDLTGQVNAWAQPLSWVLRAALLSTQVVAIANDAFEVRCHPSLFCDLLELYIEKSMPVKYQPTCDTIVIGDEFQRIPCRDGFVAIAGSGEAFHTICVGAFQPSISLPSGTRMEDAQFSVLQSDDVKHVLESRFPQHPFNQRVLTKLANISGGALRCFLHSKMMTDASRDPFEQLSRAFRLLYEVPIPQELFHAGIAETDVTAEQLKRHEPSLGCVFTCISGDSWRISVPPLQISTGLFELAVANDDSLTDIKECLKDYTKSNWAGFQRFIIAAIAVRLVCLSQCRLGKWSPLFQDCAMTPSAEKLVNERADLGHGCKLQWITPVSEQFQRHYESFQRDSTTIDAVHYDATRHRYNVDGHVDVFTDQDWLTFFFDMKHTQVDTTNPTSPSSLYLNHSDIQKAIKNSAAEAKARGIKRYVTVVVSNKTHYTKAQQNKLKLQREDVIVVTQETLASVLGYSLHIPFREDM